MMELEVARETILKTIDPLPSETVLLQAAMGRVLRETIVAAIDLPLFDNSAMDGYAVRSKDVASASPDAPVRLKLCGEVAAGQTCATPIEPATCIRVFTGSVLPTGADAVVMQEDTRIEERETVLIMEGVKPWENVRMRGEDVKQKSELFKPGDTLSAGGIGLLAALGVKSIKVGRNPVIGLLATGSELAEAGDILPPGKIYESNRFTLASLLMRAGAVPRIFPLLPDVLKSIRDALGQGFAECDGVVTTGGVSVGEYDLVKKAFEELGGQMEFWKVAIKPGKPFAFGRFGQKLLFGLPGNPVSAFVTFLLLVRPSILRWQGALNVLGHVHAGSLAEPLANTGDRRHFMRVFVDEQGNVRSGGIQASHVLGSMAKANGLVDVPANTTLERGTNVQVLRWDD